MSARSRNNLSLLSFGFAARIMAVIIILTICLVSSGFGRETSMKIIVDATDLPRKLLHSRITVAASGDSLSLLYPKWIPGIHGPRGPVENIGGFEVTDQRGTTVDWRRDWSEVYRFFVFPNKASRTLDIDLTYIASQPSTNSKGIDSYGTTDLGVINWNTILVYPEGIPTRQISTELTLILPAGWKHGSALPLDKREGDTLYFESVTLEELVDMPLLCGKYLRNIELTKTDLATYYLHVVADDEGDLPHHDDSVLIPLRKIANEAEALFGGTHFDSYHLLLTLSNSIPGMGLEHRNSSLNGVKANEFRDANWKKKRATYLLPHEFAHAWCGKYRRPVGMDTPDFMVDKDTDLLWVYEGLDSYLGWMLAARSGFVDSARFIEKMTANIGTLVRRKGRQWRPLRDTEVSAYILRGGSDYWGYMRRSQDYYGDGAIIWLEFDAMIRNATDGKKSLDDFCAAFFSNGEPEAHSVPFDRAELVSTLSSLAEGPWDSLITVRVHQAQEKYDPTVIAQCGYRMEYTDKKPEAVKDREDRWKYTSLYESLGLSAGKSGKISDIIPGSPADIAGLAPGSKIMGVEGKKYTAKRLEDAVRNSVMNGSVNLLMLMGDNYEDVTIDYSGGMRYFKLTPLDGKRQWLPAIGKSRTGSKK